MNRKLLIVLIVLCLSACATRTVRDDAPASDLDALAANVKREGKPVLLPNGKEYCLEDAESEEAHDRCGGDLEDAVFNANRRIERLVNLVLNGLHTMRRDCSVWERMFGCDP